LYLWDQLAPTTGIETSRFKPPLKPTPIQATSETQPIQTTTLNPVNIDSTQPKTTE